MEKVLEKLKSYHLNTYEHSVRVSTLCSRLAISLGFSKEECQFAKYAGLFHDVGKLKVPHYILSKPGKLSEKEYLIIQSHVLHGVEIIQDRGVHPKIVEAVLQHHEREEGTGYPYKIDDISPLGRVVGVCDVFDALTSDREYRVGTTAEEAFELLLGYRVGMLFRPYVLQLRQLLGSGRSNELTFYRADYT